MMTSQLEKLGWLTRFAAIFFLCANTLGVRADISEATSATTLRAKYQSLQASLQQNGFKKPIHMESVENSKGVTGDIYAQIRHPFATAGKALNEPARWCDIMMLHINTKFCRATADNRGDV